MFLKKRKNQSYSGTEMFIIQMVTKTLSFALGHMMFDIKHMETKFGEIRRAKSTVLLPDQRGFVERTWQELRVPVSIIYLDIEIDFVITYQLVLKDEKWTVPVGSSIEFAYAHKNEAMTIYLDKTGFRVINAPDQVAYERLQKILAAISHNASQMIA